MIGLDKAIGRWPIEKAVGASVVRQSAILCREWPIHARPRFTGRFTGLVGTGSGVALPRSLARRCSCRQRLDEKSLQPISDNGTGAESAVDDVRDLGAADSNAPRKRSVAHSRAAQDIRGGVA